MNTPVTRDRRKILWRAAPPKQDDFSEIADYIDYCLKPANVPEQYQYNLIRDFELLHELTRALRVIFPSAPAEEAEQALKEIPPRPQPPKPLPKRKKMPIKRWHQLKDQYRRDSEQYEEDLRCWKENIDEWRKRHQLFLHLVKKYGPTNVIRKRLKRLEKALKSVIDSGGLLVENLGWDLLPQSEPLHRALAPHLERLCRKLDKYDPTRIKKILSLYPDKAYVGNGQFDHYIAFIFEETPYEALLESPSSGNAIYLLKGNWRELSKLSKSELLNHHRDHVDRITHQSGRWLEIVKNKLKTSDHADY